MIPFPFQAAGAGMVQQSSVAPSGFPVIAEETGQAFATAATSHLVNMHATVNAGDGLLAEVASDGSSTNSAVTTPSGWTLIGTSYSVNSSHRMSIFWKVAAGTEGGTTVDFATTGSEEMVVHLKRYQAGTFQGTPEHAFGSAVSTNNPDPPSLTPTWGSANTSWVAGASYGINRTTTAYPYPDNNRTTQASTLLTITTCTTNVAGASLDPPSFTMATPASTAIPHTIAVRPI